ncbi:putative small integral membrane protein [Herbihabitans rhizosphaerae]|uniref:Putative small integral membrane protein n=1 Tax=Herbihabitans rhizosphaerae TaxID=1872711 RepID=A0A4Q7KD17_9PSEU|nr:DUF2165 domain-containing protein [Herbihabitans rhizosphaerae]RZS31448.1 putative small integral membrane protein [Herbihabitans rhizosphaerae]
MNRISSLGGLRVAFAVLTALGALYMGLVAFNNITDFNTNKAFVQHVFAMDTTFKSPNVMWRAITNETLVVIAYVLIIVWEALTAIALGMGLVLWLRSFSDSTRGSAARTWSTIGWSMMIALFGIGFIVIGGEWFQMWQSQKWNGLQAATQNFIVASAGLIVTQFHRKKTTDPD